MNSEYAYNREFCVNEQGYEVIRLSFLASLMARLSVVINTSALSESTKGLRLYSVPQFTVLECSLCPNSVSQTGGNPYTLRACTHLGLRPR